MNPNPLRFPSNGEFNFIRKLLDSPVRMPARGDIGPGDDCAMLDGWLLTTDISVEGTHFRLDWSGIDKAVRKCVLSNLSDINAMGGFSEWVLLGICLSRDWDVSEHERVIHAFRDVLDAQGIGILGGDTVVADRVMFQMTVLGRCPENGAPLLRSGARPGDLLYVSGRLGRSSAGLWALQHGLAATYPEAVAYHLEPDPPLSLGPKLHQAQVGACLDISDGLSSELHHMALQSGVRLRVRVSDIPVWNGLEEFCRDNGLNPRDFWLHGGEEYQLLFSSRLPESLLVLVLQSEIHCIGEVVPGSGVVLVEPDGSETDVYPGAWSHI